MIGIGGILSWHVHGVSISSFGGDHAMSLLRQRSAPWRMWYSTHVSRTKFHSLWQTVGRNLKEVAFLVITTLISTLVAVAAECSTTSTARPKLPSQGRDVCIHKFTWALLSSEHPLASLRVRDVAARQRNHTGLRARTRTPRSSSTALRCTRLVTTHYEPGAPARRSKSHEKDAHANTLSLCASKLIACWTEPTSFRI